MVREKPFGMDATRSDLPVRFVEMRSLAGRIRQMHDSIARRAYDIFERGGRMHGNDLAHWFQAERELLYPLHLEVTDSGTTLTVRTEVSGFKPNEIEVSVEPRRLVIGGKRESRTERKDDKNVYSEHRADRILRTVELPAEVDPNKVTATLRNGVLELSLPKVAEARRIRVATKVA